MKVASRVESPSPTTSRPRLLARGSVLSRRTILIFSPGQERNRKCLRRLRLPMSSQLSLLPFYFFSITRLIKVYYDRIRTHCIKLLIWIYSIYTHTTIHEGHGVLFLLFFPYYVGMLALSDRWLACSLVLYLSRYPVSLSLCLFFTPFSVLSVQACLPFCSLFFLVISFEYFENTTLDWINPISSSSPALLKPPFFYTSMHATQNATIRQLAKYIMTQKKINAYI